MCAYVLAWQQFLRPPPWFSLVCLGLWTFFQISYMTPSCFHYCVYLSLNLFHTPHTFKGKIQSVQFWKISAGMPQIHYDVHDNMWRSVWCARFIHPWSFPFTFTKACLTRTSISRGCEHVRLRFLLFFFLVSLVLLSSSVRLWQPGTRFIHPGNQTSFIPLW